MPTVVRSLTAEGCLALTFDDVTGKAYPDIPYVPQATCRRPSTQPLFSHHVLLSSQMPGVPGRIRSKAVKLPSFRRPAVLVRDQQYLTQLYAGAYAPAPRKQVAPACSPGLRPEGGGAARGARYDQFRRERAILSPPDPTPRGSTTRDRPLDTGQIPEPGSGIVSTC